MIGYITLGAKDKQRAVAFYDALLGEMGAKQVFSNDRLVFWALADGGPMIGVGDPWDGASASAGNGSMTAIPAGSRENVDKLYAKALELGGTDEGSPGERMQGFYGGYFRDPEGNKFVFFHMG